MGKSDNYEGLIQIQLGGILIIQMILSSHLR